MRGRIEPPRQILHNSRNPGSAPALGKHKIAEKKTQRVANVETNCGKSGSIRDSGGAGEGPGAKAGHEATQTRNQPGYAAAAAKILCCAPVEAHYVKADPNHQQRVQRNYNVVSLVGGTHG